MIGWVIAGATALGLFLWASSSRAKPVEPPPPPPTPPFELQYKQEYNPGEHGPPYLSADVVIEPGAVYEITFYTAKGFTQAQVSEALREAAQRIGFTLTQPVKTGLVNTLLSQAITEPGPSGRMKQYYYEEWKTQIMRTPTVTQISRLVAPTREQVERDLALMTVQASDNEQGKPPMGGMVWFVVGWARRIT